MLDFRDVNLQMHTVGPDYAVEVRTLSRSRHCVYSQPFISGHSSEPHDAVYTPLRHRVITEVTWPADDVIGVGVSQRWAGATPVYAKTMLM